MATDTPRAQPESGNKPDDAADETKPTLDADVEPEASKDKAQDNAYSSQNAQTALRYISGDGPEGSRFIGYELGVKRELLRVPENAGPIR